ncbi:MAG: hypothetical protein QOJ94_1110 [Sphingomonadales bacterium]|jgi:hypothetical protein|nr:hypothetical protein [Sphingomonadales bacterium]
MKVWAFLALAAAGAGPAQADLTATYVAVNPAMSFTMKVEIAANGDLRADMSNPGLYLIRRQGHSYFVVADPTGRVVEDTADVGAVMQEQLAKLDPHFCDEIEKMPAGKLVSRGAMTVSGRTGEAYAMESRPASRPDVVISHDPALAPLGAAMAAQFRESAALMGPCWASVPMVAQMQALLDSGAPLQFGPMRLDTVETGPIDPARFALPAAPATREQVRGLMTRPRNTVTIQPRPGN